MAVRPAPAEEARLFTLDRREHLMTVIEPALANGQTVICDRYVYSSAAYQGARGLDPQAIIAENHGFARRADVTFLMLLPVEVALERISGTRPKGFSIFEARLDLEAVDRIYRSLRDPRMVTVDATLPEDSIQEELIRHLRAFRNHSTTTTP